MRTLRVVPAHVLAQNADHVLLAEGDHVVGALPPDGTNYSLAVRILPWRLWRDEDLPQPDQLDLTSELVSVDAVSVAEKVRRFMADAWDCLEDLSPRPLGGRALRGVDVKDASPVMRKADEAVQGPEEQGGHDEEVAGDRNAHVVA